MAERKGRYSEPDTFRAALAWDTKPERQVGQDQPLPQDGCLRKACKPAPSSSAWHCDCARMRARYRDESEQKLPWEVLLLWTCRWILALSAAQDATGRTPITKIARVCRGLFGRGLTKLSGELRRERRLYRSRTMNCSSTSEARFIGKRSTPYRATISSLCVSQKSSSHINQQDLAERARWHTHWKIL